MTCHRFAMIAAIVLVPVALVGCSSNGTKAGARATSTQSTTSSSQKVATPKATGGSSTAASPSGSDSEDASDATSAEKTSEATSSEKTSDEPEDKPSDTSTDIVGAAGSAAGDSGSTAAFCTSMTDAMREFAAYSSNPNGDTQKLQDDLRSAGDEEPRAIEDDVDTIIDAYKSAVSDHEKSQPTPELEKAEKNFHTWASANCH